MQKALLAVGSGVAALQNPYRHGETWHGAQALFYFSFHRPGLLWGLRFPSGHDAHHTSATPWFDCGWGHLTPF